MTKSPVSSNVGTTDHFVDLTYHAYFDGQGLETTCESGTYVELEMGENRIGVIAAGCRS